MEKGKAKKKNKRKTSRGQATGVGEFHKYPKKHIVAIINSIKEDVNPQWQIASCPAILENGQHPELEILKPVPKDAKVEWLENKRRRPSKENKKSPRSIPANKKGPQDSNSPNLENTGSKDNAVSVILPEQSQPEPLQTTKPKTKKFPNKQRKSSMGTPAKSVKSISS